MKSPWKPTLVALEGREVPALFGTPWPNAGNLTLSFAPDNTAIAGSSQAALGAGRPSTLFAGMAAAGTPAQWQTEILRAFQTWAVNANVNIGLVPDGGSAFGPASILPGAGSSGRLRMGGIQGSPEVVAINQPYNLMSGAWSGSVLFNTNDSFAIGNQPGSFDIYSATLDEAGNVFGLADTDDPTSALYGHYSGVRAGLNAADVAAFQDLYGARSPGAWEGSGNDTFATARRLTPTAFPTDTTKQMVSAAGADLTTLDDVDNYVFTTRADTTSLTVRLETTGKSLLTAKVSVYDDQNNLVGTATSAGPLAMQDLVFTVSGVTGGRDYKVRVEKATNDVFGIGRYDLKVGYNVNPVVPVSGSTVSYATDWGFNNWVSLATPLSAVNPATNKLYVHNAEIEWSTDVDYYRVTSPAATPNPMTVVVTPAVAYGLYTQVTVYDANRVVVPSQVFANGPDGRLVVQVSAPTPSSSYYVKVESVGRNGRGLTGDYTLSVDFTQAAVSLGSVASDSLTATRSSAFKTLSVSETKLFHFTLGATTTNALVASGVRMTVYDASGQIVATLTADAGQTTSGDFLLGAGTYTIKFKAATKTGVALTNLSYALSTMVLSDPIDPYAPPDPTTPPPPDYVPIDHDDTFYIGLNLTDPWLDPWQ